MKHNVLIFVIIRSNIIEELKRRRMYCTYPYLYPFYCSSFFPDLPRFLLLSFPFCFRNFLSPLFFIFLLKKNFFLTFILFLRQRETEHERGRVRKRETQNLKQAPGSERSAQSPTRGSNSQTARS